jgi:hypothetical protein
MLKKQKTYLALSIFVVVTALILTFFYRPFVYTNNINDFGFADTIGNLASVPGACFFFWGIRLYSNKEKNKHILIATLVYTIFWETLGLIGIHGTFDWKDIVAGFISGGLTYVFKEFIEKERGQSSRICPNQSKENS